MTNHISGRTPPTGDWVAAAVIIVTSPTIAVLIARGLWDLRTR